MKRAVFLDKDGTLVKNIPFDVDPRKIKFLPGVIEGLKILQSSNFKLIVVTNQSGIARGFFKEKEFIEYKNYLKKLLIQNGVSVDNFFYCPHYPTGQIPKYTIDCFCRKPMPGLFIKATKELGINLTESWMIGDVLEDIEAGKKAGCKTVLVNESDGNKWKFNKFNTPDYIVKNFNQAVERLKFECRNYSID